MRECNCHRGPEVRKKVIGCPPKVININHPAEPVLFHRVDIPAAMGDDTTYPPENGLYKNVLLVYEANNHTYLYNSDGIPTSLSLDISDLEEAVGDLQEGLANEAEERLNTDIALREDIDDVAQDLEDFKNSPDVVDIVPTYAALQAYDTSKLGDNDEIRVLTDETHDGASAYYRWDKTNSQWTFIGITGPYYTKTETDTLIEAAKTAWAGTETTSSGTGATAEVTTTTGDFEWKEGHTVTVNFAYKASRSLLKIDSETAYSIDNVRSLSGGIDTGVAIQYVCTTVGGQRAYRPIGRLRASSDVAGPVFIEDNLTTTGTQLKALSANQGKVLDDKIKAIDSSARVLSANDYDWPTDNPDGVALWKLPYGVYRTPNSGGVKYYISTSASGTSYRSFLIFPEALDGLYTSILVAGGISGVSHYDEGKIVNVSKATGIQAYSGYIVTSGRVENSLTSSSTINPLSANQGQILNGKVGDLTTLTTTTRTSAVAAINEVNANIGLAKVLTPDDYNYPENNPSSIALWLLEPGIYTVPSTSTSVRISTNTTDAPIADRLFIVQGGEYRTVLKIIWGTAVGPAGWEEGGQLYTYNGPGVLTSHSGKLVITTDYLDANGMIPTTSGYDSSSQGKLYIDQNEPALYQFVYDPDDQGIKWKRIDTEQVSSADWSALWS